tara:strand:- start:503 stop:994 length:492 start_codon:yes stop_codon:yes gene_type:complete
MSHFNINTNNTMITTPEITIEEARVKLSHHKYERDCALDCAEPHPVTEQDIEHNEECHSKWVTHSRKAQEYKELIHSKILATVDDYIEFLSESTPFEEEGVISRAEHRDFAVRLWKAALKCGARRGNTIQVCASNCGFYRLEFDEHPDEGYATITTVDFTPEW